MRHLRQMAAARSEMMRPVCHRTNLGRDARQQSRLFALRNPRLRRSPRCLTFLKRCQKCGPSGLIFLIHSFLGRHPKNVSTFTLRLMKSIFLYLPVVLFTSCATMSRGSHDKLTVLSEPSRANVVLSSGEKGVTPTTFVKGRRDNFTVTVSKAGYVSRTVNVESKVSATGETNRTRNVLLGGPIGVTVDAVSGAYNSLYPNPVSVRLLPRRRSATAASARRGRASKTTTSSLPALKVKPSSFP